MLSSRTNTAKRLMNSFVQTVLSVQCRDCSIAGSRTAGMMCVVSLSLSASMKTKERSCQGGCSRVRHGYAFGDLRDDHIILDARGWPYLIDFDWCGKEGEDAILIT